MATPSMGAVTIAKDWRGFKVTLSLGPEQYTITGVKTLLAADVLADVCAVLAALEMQHPFDSLALRTRRSDQSRPELGAAARAALEVAGTAEVARQLQACATWMQQPTQGFSSATARTAAGTASLLLFAAAAGGHAAATHLALSICPEAASSTDSEGAVPLHSACRGCHVDSMAALLAAAPAAVHTADRRGCLPLHAAAGAIAAAPGAGEAHENAVRLLLSAAPQAVTAASHEGELPLHCAARACRWIRATGALVALLAAAPAAAGTADMHGRLPLHAAAGTGCVPALQMLLVAAPGSAGSEDRHGCCALHYAASEAGVEGATAAVQLLLGAAPEVATKAGGDGRLPLERALGTTTLQSTAARQAVARCLLCAGPAVVVLSALARMGRDRGWPLLADAVVARLPLAAEEWAAVPFACPGLGGALAAALAHSPGQARQLLHRLPRSDLIRIRLLALCVARVQRRRLGCALPTPLVHKIMCLAVGV